MKITLISPFPDITAFGIRTMAACLKEHGHSTRMIFLPDPYGDAPVFGVPRYQGRILDEIVPLCADSDLIGITLMTNFFDSALQITRKLKEKTSAPVVWGGVHPTIRPEECVEHADIVCVGDGEEALLELADSIAGGRDYKGIDNLWIKTDAGITKNPLRPLQKNLDVYPRPDYSLDDHHVLFDGHVRPLTSEIMEIVLKGGTVSRSLHKAGYQTMTGRGCPHQCTYCINDTIKKLYQGQTYLRWRSTAHVMDELAWVRKHMPYVGLIWISDDAFLGRSTTSLREFCTEYKEKIGLPFTCLASPLTVSDEKMEMLVGAGLVYLQMGLESGSGKIQALFNRRKMSNEVMMKAIRTINRYKSSMYPPSYDFILDTPYESDEDRIETLKFISEIPKPYRLQPFSLVLSPGTRLYDMAKEDGHIGNERKEVYSKTWVMREHDYFNLLITFARGGHFPSRLLRTLVSRPVIAVVRSRPAGPVFKLLFTVLKGMNRLLKRMMGKT